MDGAGNSAAFEPNAAVGVETDEGFAEPFRIDYILNVWRNKCSDRQRLEVVFQLLNDLPTPYLGMVASRISPLLHKDFISQLPYELAVQILSLGGHKHLPSASLVSRYWNQVANDVKVWKSAYCWRGTSLDLGDSG